MSRYNFHDQIMEYEYENVIVIFCTIMNLANCKLDSLKFWIYCITPEQKKLGDLIKNEEIISFKLYMFRVWKCNYR